MSSFPGAPKLAKGGIVLLDAETAAVRRVVVLQYNPDTLTRTLQVQGVGGESGDRLEALRLKGPPVETIKLEAEIDAADQLESALENATTTMFGVLPQLAALETIVSPTAAELLATEDLARSGTLEIAPVEAPLTLFVWGNTRVLPVRLVEFSISEEAFDPSLHPIRAKVNVTMRVLTTSDLPVAHRGASLFLAQQQQKERLAALASQASPTAMGLGERIL